MHVFMYPISFSRYHNESFHTSKLTIDDGCDIVLIIKKLSNCIYYNFKSSYFELKWKFWKYQSTNILKMVSMNLCFALTLACCFVVLFCKTVNYISTYLL